MSTWSSFLHHPAFQSLLLPCVLALLAMAVLRAVCGARWAPLGAALGLLGALAWLPGFEWPAASRVAKLPWVVLAGLALAAAAMALQRGGHAARQAGAPVQPAQPAGAASAGALTVSALGLAALAGGGGSMLLAQLALMLATCSAVLGAWLWLRPAPAALPLAPLLLAWLALAWSWALSSAIAAGAASTTTLNAAAAADAARLALLALAFAAPPLLLRLRWAQARPRWTPPLAALLAALPVIVAVVWQFSTPAAQAPGTPDDDPYYTPA